MCLAYMKLMNSTPPLVLIYTGFNKIRATGKFPLSKMGLFYMSKDGIVLYVKGVHMEFSNWFL